MKDARCGPAGKPSEGGVALRFPPHSKAPGVLSDVTFARLQTRTITPPPSVVGYISISAGDSRSFLSSPR